MLFAGFLDIIVLLQQLFMTSYDDVLITGWIERSRATYSPLSPAVYNTKIPACNRKRTSKCETFHIHKPVVCFYGKIFQWLLVYKGCL